MQSNAMVDRDIEDLLALNRAYLAAVQQSDAGQFAEILAEDFLCSNPDASIVDKPRFWSRSPSRRLSRGSRRRTSVCASSVTWRSSTLAPPTSPRAASSAKGATPMCGSVAMALGWQSQRT